MGGGGSTTTSGIAPEFIPYIRDVLSDAEGRYQSTVKDPSKLVSSLDPSQEEALKAQESQGRQMMAGTGIYDLSGLAKQDLQNTLGGLQGQASMGGALGSARSQAATQKALGDVSANYLQQQQQNVLAGGKLMGDVGQSLQQQKQKMLDAPHLGASRYFGYLTGAPQQKVQTTTGGGK